MLQVLQDLRDFMLVTRVCLCGRTLGRGRLVLGYFCRTDEEQKEKFRLSDFCS